MTTPDEPWILPAMTTRLGVLIVVVVLAVVAGCSLMQIKTIGAPRGNSGRVGETIVTMMTRLEPYVPTLNRSGGSDRYTVGLLIHSARDASVRRYLQVASGLEATSLTHVTVTDIDGDRVWFRGPEQGVYDVATRKALVGEQIGGSNISPPVNAKTLSQLNTGERALFPLLASGAFPSPTRWLGVLTDAEAAGSFKPGLSISKASAFERSKEPRRLYTTEVEPADGKPRVKRLEPLGGEGMLNGAFVRQAADGDALRLTGDGYLIAYESKPYRAGNVILVRIDMNGKVIWTLDSGIGELKEVLPDPDFPVLIGERPRIPDKLSEPILVSIDAATGKSTTHSLWFK